MLEGLQWDSTCFITRFFSAYQNKIAQKFGNEMTYLIWRKKFNLPFCALWSSLPGLNGMLSSPSVSAPLHLPLFPLTKSICLWKKKEAAIFLFRLWVEIWGGPDARRVRIRPSLKSREKWIFHCLINSQWQACKLAYQYTGRRCDVNITWWCIWSLDVLRDAVYILFTWR